jgi:hypothetical protein
MFPGIRYLQGAPAKMLMILLQNEIDSGKLHARLRGIG